jgi:ammonium transporter, Amt family
LTLAGLVGLAAAEDVADAVAPVAEAVADAAPTLDSGNTAWMIVACGLVLFMTLPGLALFYGGLVRAKNVLNIFMACFGSAALISVLWACYGYSVAFDTTGMAKDVVGLHAIIGGMAYAFMGGVTPDAVTGSIPTTVFAMFQLTFAIITPALIVGAFAERMKFWTMMVFSGLWFTIVYLPICHMAWGGDGALFWDWGVMDFAGGTVVHINAGIAGLVAAFVLGKRKGYPHVPMKPHNLVLAAIGAGMLWVGWFGFNAGSALAADGAAGNALLVTHLATAAACFAWMLCEQIKHGKPSLLGAISGAVAGLVAITPAAGAAGPMGSLLLGAVAGVGCFFGATTLKKMGGYDDALDAFGVHGVGGIIGAILTAVVASPFFQGTSGDDYAMGHQLWVQTKAVLITIVWTGVVTFVLLKVLDALMGLRVSDDDEARGLDISLHGEEAYNHE